MVVGMPKRAVLTVLLATVLGTAAFGQMDMLPQIFRDLPPELQQGLPEQMSFAEYRELNRNVDFFTMFMSIFVPGYGLFQVEHPELAWGVVGARVTGYGMMGAAVALQWNHFYGLIDNPQLSFEDFQRLLTNGLIFGGGVIVAGLSWAADVVLAYHIAKQEKDLVQYKYGIRSSIYGGIQGGGDAASEERYLRRLLSQQTDEALAEQLLVALPEYARRYPDEPFSGEALYFTALLLAERRLDADALRLAVRSAYLYPSGDRTGDALRLVGRLLERNRAWDVGYEGAAGVTRLPASADRAARMLAGVRAIGALNGRVFTEAALDEVRYFLEELPSGPHLIDGLAIASELLLELDRPEEAARYLAALVIEGPDYEGWAGHALTLAELYLGPLADRRRAQVLLTAIVEEAPESEEAERARELLPE